MGLSTTYTKVETDYLLQKLESELVSGLKGELKISDAAPTAQGLYILSDIGTYANLGGLVATADKLNYAYFDGTTWSLIATDLPQPIVNNVTNNYTLDPEQIVPSEALYNDETLAGDILKRVDKSGKNINYKRTTKWFDGTNLSDEKMNLSERLILKIGNDYYKATTTIFDVKMFGAVGDGVTDDRAAIQKAVDFCENAGIKQLFFPRGQYYVSDAIVFKRGGIDVIGSGALRREESWQFAWGRDNYPNVYTNTTTYNQREMYFCTILVEQNKSGFIFDKSVCDGFKIKGLGFRTKSGIRTIGNTKAIEFKAEFFGPTWSVEIEECHFSNFNKVFHVNSELAYCLAFVKFYNNSFSHNDECIYYDYATDNDRCVSWGFEFVGNKAHDNSRVIYALCAKELVSIVNNNFEGSISREDGTFAPYSVDLELDNASCQFYGNHFEVSQIDAVYITSLRKDRFGNYKPTNNTAALANFHKVELMGNNLDGLNIGLPPSIIQDNKHFVLEGVSILNKDNYPMYLHACEILQNFAFENNIFLSDKAKTDGTAIIFSDYCLHSHFANYSYQSTKNFPISGTPIVVNGKEYFKDTDIPDNLIYEESIDFDFDGNPKYFGYAIDVFTESGHTFDVQVQPKSSRVSGFEAFPFQYALRMLYKNQGRSVVVAVFPNKDYFRNVDTIKNYFKPIINIGGKMFIAKSVFGFATNDENPVIKPIAD